MKKKILPLERPVTTLPMHLLLEELAMTLQTCLLLEKRAMISQTRLLLEEFAMTLQMHLLQGNVQANREKCQAKVNEGQLWQNKVLFNADMKN